MFNFIFSKIDNTVSQAKIFFIELYNSISNTIGFFIFLINSFFDFLYNYLRATYSFMYVFFHAREYADSTLLKRLTLHKKNAYALARALCRYIELFGHTYDIWGGRFNIIASPQNTQPFESVELARHFIRNYNSNRGHQDLNENFFELASKACIWGVAEPYRIAVDYLIANYCYTEQRGLRLISLEPAEMLQYARRIVDREGEFLYNADNIGSSLPDARPPHHFRRLLARINQNDDARKKIAIHMSKILHFFHMNPEHLRWADEIASQALEGCVNQPLMGWLEICAWVHIAKQPTIVKKLEAAKFLQALSHVKLIIANRFSDRPIYYPEYVCALMQSVYYKLCGERVMTEPWVGICDDLWTDYRRNIEFRDDILFEREKICVAIKNMKVEDAIETVFMQSAGRAFWARIAIPSEELRNFGVEVQKERNYLEQVILYLSGSPLNYIHEDLREMGYQVDEFNTFLERKCPGHHNNTVEQKIAAVGALHQELQGLFQAQEISINQKALIWTYARVQPFNRSVAQRVRA